MFGENFLSTIVEKLSISKEMSIHGTKEVGNKVFYNIKIERSEESKN